MLHYRLYLLGRDGRIHSPALDLECRDDARAIELALERYPDARMELWQGARLVRTFGDPSSK